MAAGRSAARRGRPGGAGSAGRGGRTDTLPAPPGRLAPRGPGASLSQGPAARSGAGRAARPAPLGGRRRKLWPPGDRAWGAVTFAAGPPALGGSGGDSACRWRPGVSPRKWVPKIPA